MSRSCSRSCSRSRSPDEFDSIDNLETATYLVAFFTTAITSVLLMTPTTFHRIRFRQGDKEALLQMATRFTLAGMASLSVAMVSVIWLVSELVLTQPIANFIAAISAVVILGLWFADPALASRRRRTIESLEAHGRLRPCASRYAR